jgi:hypothetical protein
MVYEGTKLFEMNVARIFYTFLRELEGMGGEGVVKSITTLQTILNVENETHII